jgi:hypothetical protein
MTGCPHFLRPVVVGGGRVVWGCGCGAGVGVGGARKGPAACRVALRSGPAPALAPFPVPGRSSLWTVSCCWGGWLVLLLRGCAACGAVGGCLQSGRRHRRPPRRRVSPAQFFLADCGGIVCWVGFLSDVIGGVEIALWEGCYPASVLSHGVCVLVYV